MIVRKMLYGSIFIVVLPALLVLWAKAAARNVTLPVFGGSAAGVAIALAGLALMATAMRDLWRFGGGLPMNAFPPPNFVKRGAFHLLPHPIYTGFVMLCAGVSIAVGSRAGFWLISPTVAFACAALVLGYERLDLEWRFKATIHLLPANDDTPPSSLDRVRFLLCVGVPWVALYEVTSHIGVRGVPFRFGFENHLPVWTWTASVYESVYVVAAAAPWLARTRRDLRRLTISAWLSMAVVFPFYWAIPSSAPRRPFAGSGWLARLLSFEVHTYPPVNAFPSFHVLWAVLVARLFRRRWIGIAYAAAVAISCITTGMHYVPDVLAAFAIAPAFLFPERIWRGLLRLTQTAANGWREWRLGPVRIINHGLFAGLGAFIQVAVVIFAAGPGREWEALATAIAGLIGAAAWAQWVEGSSRLRRPFGFYGGLIGTGICCLFFADRWVLLGANCLAAPWLQALGRIRCLVNGCCHGAPAPEKIGIRVTHPRSRVTRLANLTNIPIHATQLYSILGNIFIASILTRLWLSGGSLSLVCGVYAIGNGCARFAEEAYRGEPQTKVFAGLRLYQWIAIASVVTGAVVTCLPSPAAPPLVFSPSGLAWAAAFACVAAAALGVDFPESEKALARLT